MFNWVNARIHGGQKSFLIYFSLTEEGIDALGGQKLVIQ
jgi:hypothetical protein